MTATSPRPTSYAIIGTGALGGYYGARLAQAGADVHFLCHRDGPWVREHGLVVESIGRSILQMRAQAYDRPEDMPPCDVTIVALKTTANSLLPHLLPPVVKPGGVVLVMQNGWDVERDTARVVPGALVLGGLCFVCANKTGPGRILHLDYGDVLIGWFDEQGMRPDAERWMHRIAGDLRAARIITTLSDDLRLSRWKKLVWNIPYNGLSVIHRTTTDRLMADPVRRADVIALMREVQQSAAANGCIIEEAFIQKMLDDTERMKPYKTSMLLDFESGRPLELEAMYERTIQAAASAGVVVPRITRLWTELANRT
jgi:2-dehydropantoate 2-reductase